MAGSVRLIKIASEINLGKDAIVEFLRGKGFTVDNKPTEKLSEEMVEAIYNKFKKELKAAETQRQKIEKHKQIRKASDSAAREKEVYEDAPVHTPVVEETQPNTPVVHHEPEPAPAPEPEVEAPAPAEPEPAPAPEVQEAPEVKAEEAPEPNPAAEPAHAQEEITMMNDIDKPLEKYKVNDVIQLPEDDRGRRSKKKTGKEIAKEAKDKKKAQATKKAEAKPQQPAAKAKPAETDKAPAQQTAKKPETKPAASQEDSSDPNAPSKKKRKVKKIAEVEFDANNPPKLKGLTVVGKIDLDSQKTSSKDGGGKPSRRGDKKPHINDDDEDGAKNKNKKKKGAKSLKETSDANAKNKKKKKLSVREVISDEEINKNIRRTLNSMNESIASSNRNKMKQKKKAEREEKEMLRIEEEAKEAKILHLTEFVTTADLAKMIGVNASEIIMKCMGLGLMVSINQRLDKDTITVIADDYGLEVDFIDEKAVQAIDKLEEEDEGHMLPRSPIVTIMGHVDHGKTSLLDYIRNANVVAGEAGGITQHIGAYRVELKNGKSISFLDTPGHEAFTAMRARGAQVTDLVILVVAADDSVMPQTIEAISHASAANVPIIVAINKVDKPDAQPDRIRQQLADHNVLVEEWGGKYQCAEISAKKGINIDELLDKVLLEAELLELKANPDRVARATVIEANMTKGLGPVCTVIVQKGTLKVGDPFVVGHQYGRVRAMMDERGKKMEQATPSMPARVMGLNGLPEAGDILNVTESDVEARNIANERQQLRRQQEFKRTKQVTLDDISKQINEGSIKDLSLIIKGDVGGSVEALSDSLLKLSTDEVRVNIIHKGVGTISESDVMLASASGAIIVGFQVSPTAHARKVAEAESVDIRQYSIIYDCIDEIKRALEGLLAPELKEDVTAVIEVRKIFKISRIGVIAGCQVMSGKIHRNDKVRVLRDGLPIFTGYIDSLKRNKDDVREVDSGYECGISLEGFNDIDVGDVIEGFKVLEIKRTLD